MTHASSSLLPSRGLAFGEYPQRARAGDAAAFEGVQRWLFSHFARPAAARLPGSVTQSLNTARKRLRGLDAAMFECEIDALRLNLRRRGLDTETAGAALALAGEAMARTLGKTPYDTQLQAAWLMLNGRLVEMATGERGSTTATGSAPPPRSISVVATTAALRSSPPTSPPLPPAWSSSTR